MNYNMFGESSILLSFYLPLSTAKVHDMNGVMEHVLNFLTYLNPIWLSGSANKKSIILSSIPKAKEVNLPDSISKLAQRKSSHEIQY